VYAIHAPRRGGYLESENDLRGVKVRRGYRESSFIDERVAPRKYDASAKKEDSRRHALKPFPSKKPLRKKKLGGGFAVLLGMVATLAVGGDLAPKRAEKEKAGAQPGKMVGRKEAAEVYLFTPDGKIKNNNGSFELGIGTSDVFPGYQYVYQPYNANLLDNLKNPPPLPACVTDEHHSGAKSLCFTLDKKGRIMQLFLHPPFIKTEDCGKPINLSFWIKASKPGCGCSFRFSDTNSSLGKHRHRRINQEWIRIKGTVSIDSDGPGIRIDLAAGAPPPSKIWIDDLVWSFEDTDYTPPPAEILIDPISRDSMVFAGSSKKFKFKFRGESGKKVKTELYLRDNIRDGLTTRLLSVKKSLSSEIDQESFNCPPLRRGIYMLAAIVRDAASGKIIAQDHQRFVVLTDLSKLPPPADFTAGGMYVFHEPLGFTSRGAWSMEELFRINSQLGCRIIRDLHTWEQVEPLYGKRDWPFYDFLMDSASKYKCGFMLDIPGVPFKVGSSRLDYARKHKKWYIEKEHAYLMGAKHKMFLAKNLNQEDFIALQKGDLFWMPKLDYMKDFCRAFLSRYKDRGLMVVEYKNEVSAMVPPDYNVEKIMKPLYPVMKKAAPNIPLFVNCTGGSRLKYIQKVVDAGGLPYMDGFSFHPYTWNTLRFDSLENVFMYRDFFRKVSPDRKILLAQTEEIFMYSLGIQRLLSDWVGGCTWSAGIPWRSFYGRTHAAYVGAHNTGPLTPSELGIYANGMYAVLAGAKCIHRAEKVSKTIVASFEKPAAGGGKEYVIALCTAYKPGKALLLPDFNPAGLHCRAYDATGEEIPVPKGGLILTERPFYLVSSDKRILEQFAEPKHKWIYNAHARVFSEDSARPVTQEIVAGVPPYVVGCTPGDWEVGAGKIGPDRKPRQDKTVKLKPCLAFPGSGNLYPEPVEGAQYLYLTSQVWTDETADNVMSISAFGIKDAVLVVNGKRVDRKIAFKKDGKLGADWIDVPVKLAEGANKIEMFVKPSTAERPALRFRIQPFKEHRLAQLLSPIVDKTRNDLTQVPGVLLASHLLNGGDEDFFNPKSKLYELLKDPCLLEYVFYSTNKRQDAYLFIRFADSAPHVITSYHFQPRFYRFPPNWKFEGSNDGKQWTTLDDVTGFKNLRGRFWSYDKKLDNTTAYKEYRIVIPAKPFLLAWKDLRFYGE